MVGRPQLVVDIHYLADRCSRVTEHLDIRIREPSVHVTFMGKEVLCGPQELHSCRVLFLKQVVGDGIEVLHAFFQSFSFRGYIKVMEAIILNTELSKKFERHIDTTFREGNGIDDAVFPWSLQGLFSERILTSSSGESMPEAYREAEPVFHRLSHNDLFWIVEAKREGIRRIDSLVLNRTDARKEGHRCAFPEDSTIRCRN